MDLHLRHVAASRFRIVTDYSFFYQNNLTANGIDHNLSLNKMSINKFKKQLEEELKLVEVEMSKVGRINPSNSKDWEPVETDMGSDPADSNDVADEMESFGENRAILGKLELQFNDIKDALERIRKGTYGKCEVGGEDIPEARLEANPSAKTCVKHAK